MREIARLLKVAAEKIEAGDRFGTLQDANGNTVGSWTVNLSQDFFRLDLDISNDAFQDGS